MTHFYLYVILDLFRRYVVAWMVAQRESADLARVLNDNPYSGAHFKTLKYRPDYPDRFGSLVEVRGWARAFFHWYNQQHYHTSLGLLTPATVHYGQAQETQAQRQQVLQAAYKAHPERSVRGRPRVQKLPTAVWINKPDHDCCPEPDPTLDTTPEFSQSP